MRFYAGLCVPGAGDPKKMTDEQMKVHSKSIHKEWKGLLSNIDMWKKSLERSVQGRR